MSPEVLRRSLLKMLNRASDSANQSRGKGSVDLDGTAPFIDGRSR
jgi:hypothetical protein